MAEQEERLTLLQGESAIARIAKLPPFWREDPGLWFSQVEATFAITQITRDETKFQYLVANANTSILPHIAHIIRAPPTQDRYNVLKERILSAFAEEEEVRLRKVLRGQLLGDLMPSHFL